MKSSFDELSKLKNSFLDDGSFSKVYKYKFEEKDLNTSNNPYIQNMLKKIYVNKKSEFVLKEMKSENKLIADDMIKEIRFLECFSDQEKYFTKYYGCLYNKISDEEYEIGIISEFINDSLYDVLSRNLTQFVKVLFLLSRNMKFIDIQMNKEQITFLKNI